MSCEDKLGGRVDAEFGDHTRGFILPWAIRDPITLLPRRTRQG